MLNFEELLRISLLNIIMCNFAIVILKFIIMKKIKVMIFAALGVLAAACNDNDNIADIENVKPVEIVNGQENGFDYADLGLPSGTLWATCNVGATLPEQAGLYFAWGETVGYTAEQVENGKRSFDEDTYNKSSAASISGNLTLEQDAAHVHMGGKWRMPTYDDFVELNRNCVTSWIEKNGICGKLFTSVVNGNSIFFPTSGSCYGKSIVNFNDVGYYWSATGGSANTSPILVFKSSVSFSSFYSRYYGRTVRGVCKRR